MARNIVRELIEKVHPKATLLICASLHHRRRNYTSYGYEDENTVLPCLAQKMSHFRRVIAHSIKTEDDGPDRTTLQACEV